MHTKNLRTPPAKAANRALQTLALTALLSLSSSACMASEVLHAVNDNTVGKGIGGLSGLMLGAATGGPIGAVVGGLAGIWIGATSQQASGLSEPGYLVKTTSGEEVRVRSPQRRFSPGEQVVVQGNRLYPAH